MKILVFLALFCVISNDIAAQKNDWYWADGRGKCDIDTTKYKTIDSFKDYYGDQGLAVSVNTTVGLVYYIPLTHQPIAVLASSKSEYDQALSEFSKEKYTYYFPFEYDFKNLQKLSYDKEKIVKLLGEPISTVDDEGVYERLYYNKFYIQFIKSGLGNSYLDKFVRLKFDGARKNSLGITDFGINLSDLDDDYVTGFRATYWNFSKKKIKYIYTTITALNAVDDVIQRKTLTSIGPIEPEDAGSYSFDKAFFSKLIESIRISQLKIQYFDGTTKILVNPTLKASYIEVD